MATENRHSKAILAALLLSGAAGLVHEIAWAKMLQGLIGSTAHAHAAVLTVFMGGLAVGAVLFGRRSDRREHPLATYVRLEVLIAVYSLVLPWIVDWTGAAYEAAVVSVDGAVELKFGLRFVLALLVIAAPAIWMGGTLPILARHLIDDLTTTRRHVASLYALNNLGAVLGTGAAGFVLLPKLGLHPSLGVASALNLAAALLVWRVLRATPAQPPAPEVSTQPAPTTEPEDGASYSPAQFKTALVCLALAGFAAMGYEVVFLRLIAMAFGSSTYSFTVMLMAFIVGIGIGSGIIAYVGVRRPFWWLAVSQLAVVVSLVAMTPLLERLPYLIGLARIALQDTPGGFEWFLATKAGLCLLFLLPPTICIGFGFPLVAQVQARSLSRVGSAVGSTYAWNTVGNVLGVLVTSLVLLPMIGLTAAFHVNLGFSVLAAFLLLAVTQEATALARTAACCVLAVALGAYAFTSTDWADTSLLARNHLRMREGPDPAWSEKRRAQHPASSFDAWKARYVGDRSDYPVWFEREDANVTVLAAGPSRDLIVLYVNTKPDASTGTDLRTQLLLGHVPMLMNPDAKNALVIGHGSGITTGSAMLHPVERADVVEISSGVLEADAVFAPHNNHVLSDPRVIVTQDDGRTFLRTVPQEYDVIISVPSNPWIAGIAGLFTQDYFEDCQARLAPNGVLAFWFQEYEQSDEGVQLMLRTLRSVFDNVMLFQLLTGDVFAIASAEPLVPDFEAMEQRFDDPIVRADLARAGIHDLASLLAHHVVPPGRIDDLLVPGPLNTDGHQRLEYLAPETFFRGGGTNLITRTNEFRIGGTQADCMLDDYVRWRARGPEPMSLGEIDGCVRYLHAVLGPDRDKDAERGLLVFRRRLGPRTAPAATYSSPARGGLPDPTTLGFTEALGRGRALHSAGRDADARRMFERALELRPDSESALQGLAATGD